MFRACLAFTIAALNIAGGLAALPAAAGDKIDFAQQVQPILHEHCGGCHGAVERNGGLSFDDQESLFVEADSGNLPVVAGNPEASELIKRIRSADTGDQMPPDGDRLSDDEIDILTRWISQGAPWLQDDNQRASDAATNDHWSFQPLRETKPPHVSDQAWPQSTLDRFLLANRESAGLQVAPDADPVALIRRASYGLTGLPPTARQVHDFVADAQSEKGLQRAFADLVDRLLSEPAYGERWGRHWMDWVRYADTAGDNSDYPIPQAYLYRNYIIDALNEDLPYDRFLIEQIAGDLLPAASQEQHNRQVIATGYLALARRFGSLVERYPWHLTIEDTIDNMGRTMLGLSIACARCHNHKFDPISTRDYYALYGIFASTRYPFPGIELFQSQKDFVPLIPETEVAEVTKEFQATTDELTAELERLLARCDQQALENAAKAGQVSLQEQRKLAAELDGMLLSARRAGEKLAAHLKKIPPLPTAYAVCDGQPKNARIQIKGEPDRLGAEVPRQFLEILGGHRLSDDLANASSGRLQLAHWIASPENPLTARVIVNRVWQRHFGHGLVSSASDFGLRGERPTHPELLDFLAAEFIDSGWSLKHLHRVIMNSRSYRLSSQDVESNLATDPTNRFYWKFNRQRLDAESLRDSLLLVAGTLDQAMQREPHPFPETAKWSYTQHHPFKDDYPSQKRSVYLMTKRLTAQPYFQTFDGADPNVCTSDRDQSVTALQALFFVNDRFIHEQAGQAAQRLLDQPMSNEQRLRCLFMTILCREATPEETGLLHAHLAKLRSQVADDPKADLQIWSSLVRSLMRLNEFLYVD